MLKKFVIVGLGGSGGKTVRTTHASIDRLLRSKGWTSGVPQAWQFIHLDVPAAPDGLDPELPPSIPGTYYGLVPAGTNYAMIDKSLAQGTSDEVALRATAGWRPDPAAVPVPISLGAGQYRALGRVVTVRSLETMNKSIEDAMARVNEGVVEGELREAANRLGADAVNPMDAKTYVLIVSSMAGGSGAGMVVDAVEVALSQFGDKSVIGWLYAPDVFDDLPTHSRQGVRPNALATLMEWTSAFWNNEGLPKTGALFESRGVTIAVRDPSNPVAMMLVGKTNGSVTFPNQNTVYTAAGRMMAALMTSEAASDELVAYCITNRMNNSPRVDLLELKEHPDQMPPFQAFGFGRVGLGLDIFSDYVSEWLARAVVEVLLRKHEDERGLNDNRTEQELVEAVGDRAFFYFLSRCGLNEQGPNDNQVADALQDETRSTRRFDELKAVIGQAVESAFVKPAGKEQVVAQITASAYAERLRFAQDLATDRLQSATGWVVVVQESVLAAATDAMARYGLPVAQHLLDRLIEVEVPAILDDLRGEVAEYSRWAGELQGSVYNALAGAPATIPATYPMVADAVGEAATRLWYEAQADLRTFAMELLEDLREGYLKPLLIAVRGARDILSNEDKPQGGLPSQIRTWPEGSHVPLRFRPPMNEFLLVDPSAFSSVRERPIIDSVPGLPGDTAVGEAIAQVAQGKIDKDSPVAAITQPGRWVPVNHLIRPPEQAAARARFELKLRAEDLLGYAMGWMRMPERAMGRYVAQSLRTYLSDKNIEEGERIRRVERLCSQLTAAMKAGRPLASINPAMAQAVHNIPGLADEPVFSEIPVAGLDGTEKRVRETLINALGAEKARKVEKDFFGDGQGTDIEIFTVTQPAEALVFESVIGPIQEEWFAAAQQKMTREGFWKWRRARPLTEFVPMAPDHRRAFVRGWFTATMMGQLDTASAKAMRVKDPAGKWLDFPHPLLWEPTKDYDKLPAVLKSVAVAWLGARKRQSLDPLRPYYRLIELGCGPRQPNKAVVLEEINPEFEAWLTSDQAHREQALDYLGQVRVNYGAIIDATKDPHRSPRVFEIEEDVMGAFDALTEQATEAGKVTVY